jgi:hypothetical protein
LESGEAGWALPATEVEEVVTHSETADPSMFTLIEAVIREATLVTERQAREQAIFQLRK